MKQCFVDRSVPVLTGIAYASLDMVDEHIAGCGLNSNTLLDNAMAGVAGPCLAVQGCAVHCQVVQKITLARTSCIDYFMYTRIHIYMQHMSTYAQIQAYTVNEWECIHTIMQCVHTPLCMTNQCVHACTTTHKFTESSHMRTIICVYAHCIHNHTPVCACKHASMCASTHVCAYTLHISKYILIYINI